MYIRNFFLTHLLAISLSLLVAGCASGYNRFYQAAPGATPEAIAARRANPPPVTPIVEHSSTMNKEKLDAYNKRGYVVFGYSFFNSSEKQPEASAVRQGQKVGADLVLILKPKYTGSVTTTIPITTPTSTSTYSTGSATIIGSGDNYPAFIDTSGTATTYGSRTDYIPFTVHYFNYGALFFVKQRFHLGVLTRDLNDAERQEFQSNKGAVVRLVVDETPAFDADILVGDVITAVDGNTVSSAKALYNLLHERYGKVTLSIVRRGQHIEKSVQLNP